MAKEILNKPGVYKFLNENGEILYIGKAINLKKRVASYFNGSLDDRPWVKTMIPLIRDIQTVETENELEALVLESALIKKYQPKYNSDLKDDKSYSWIHISTNEDFPKLKILRQKDIKSISTGKLFGPYPSGGSVKRVFTYLRKLYPFCTCEKKAKRECLYFHIGLCPGPYQGHITKEDYAKNISGIIRFLTGKSGSQIKELEKKMKEYSSDSEYEKAAEIRDKIADLKYVGASVSNPFFEDEEEYIKRRGEIIQRMFNGLRSELSLNKLTRIECYDISNIAGQDAYGSMVVNEKGIAKNSEYRIFKIESLNTPNDPAMLREVLTRRFSNTSFDKLPEIILVDGGKSQLSVVCDVVPKNIVLLGISKGKRLHKAGFTPRDEIWISKDGVTKRINVKNEAVLINLRDEAHRFAIAHFKKAHLKRGLRSTLLKIEGMGERRVKNLMLEFGTLEGIKKANEDDINRVIKDSKVTQRIIDFLNT